ncbi:MAG TPA: F0F1 ATP synthase subunit delta [Burkholderiaceae bacterium]|jgi:F-type H+-transporting ATPase subunit delta|nr:F0F1 ATP synthase subunit delta [Burkholderiaceae bacterium]
MAELATIARPYAEALFNASQGDLNGASQWLDALASVAGNPQLLQYAGNPKVRDQQVFDLISDVARVQLPPAGQNFLRTVIENGRLAALPEVAQQFREMKNAQGGSSDAVVYSAFPIAAEQLGAVAQALEKRFGRKLNLTVREDPSLIGGIRVVVGDEVLDTSVKARLEQMKVALTA